MRWKEDSKAMRIAVIGGSGFIGSHIVDRLLIDKHDVTIMDVKQPAWNLHSDMRDPTAVIDVALKDASVVPFFYLDIRDRDRVDTLLGAGYDAVYLLSAVSDFYEANRRPLAAIDVNIQGVGHVLESVSRCGIKRLIFASTIWVYDLSYRVDSPMTEDVPLYLDQISHMYTATKLSAELVCRSYQNSYGIEVTILRYGVPYGPRGRLGTVVTNFVKDALEGKPLLIHGDGTASRSFIYVEELALGNVAALQPLAGNKTYNLGGVRQVTIKEVAETVQQLIPGTQIEYRPARQGDIRTFTVSSEKAKEELGWSPDWDIKYGVYRTYKWMAEKMGIAEAHQY